MANKIEDEDKALFQAFVKDVRPLKKKKVIDHVEPKSIKPCIPLNVAHRDIEEVFRLPEKIKKITPTPIKKINPHINYIGNPITEVLITAEASLCYGLEKLSPAHQLRLKKGEISINARIDLHGQNREQALEKLNRFLQHAHAHHLRNLLIVHGKGAKHGNTPILKQEIYYYLTQHPDVLTMMTANQKHGGTGASYVILKKTRQNQK